MDPTKMVVVFYDQRFDAHQDKMKVLKMFFEDEHLTNGGEIDSINLNEKGRQAFVYFKDKNVADRLASVKKLSIGSMTFQIKSNNKCAAPIKTTTEWKRSEITSSPDAQQLKSRRPVIIDGNNVGISHGREKVFSCRGLVIAIDFFVKLGHQDVKAVVPRFRRSVQASEMPSQNPELLDGLNDRGHLVYTPNKVYDDEIILTIAMENDAVVVSNDQFRDFYHEAKFAGFLNGYNRLEYTMTGDTFIIPTFPHGRDGPSLDEILTRSPSNDSVRTGQQDSGQAGVIDENAEKPEYYCFFTDSNANSENKLRMYFGMIVETTAAHLRLSIRQFETERAGFLLRAFTSADLQRIMAKHQNEARDLESLSVLRLESVQLSKEMIVEAKPEASIDEIKLFIQSLDASIKFVLEQLKSPAQTKVFILNLVDSNDAERLLSSVHGANQKPMIISIWPYCKAAIEKFLLTQPLVIVKTATTFASNSQPAEASVIIET